MRQRWRSSLRSPWRGDGSDQARACPVFRADRTDDTFDVVYGGQRLRLLNTHHCEYGFQPIVVFDDSGSFVSAMLRPAAQPNDVCPSHVGHLAQLR